MKDTSARRLYEIVSSAFARNGTETTAKVWAATFGLREDDVAGIYRQLALLWDLTEEVERDIQAVVPEADYPLYLRWRNDLRGVLRSKSLETRWSEQLKLFDQTDLTSIQFCAAKLAEGETEIVIPADELKEFKSEIDELFDRVVESSLDPELRRAILESLEAIRRAIADYRIRGAAGIREALARARGEILAVAPAAAEEIKKESSFVKRFGGLLQKGHRIIREAARTART